MEENKVVIFTQPSKIISTAPVLNNEDGQQTTRGVGDAVLTALIPFSGEFSPEQVRRGLRGPILSDPPAAIWRRTTFTHTTSDGAFCLYACERTGQAMWVPSGDYFVADRPRGVQPAGTVMDYLLSQRRQVELSSGYGITHVKYTKPREDGNIRRARRHMLGMRGVPSGNMVSRPPHRHNPIARPQPSAPGAGSQKTSERLDKLLENFPKDKVDGDANEEEGEGEEADAEEEEKLEPLSSPTFPKPVNVNGGNNVNPSDVQNEDVDDGLGGVYTQKVLPPQPPSSSSSLSQEQKKSTDKKGSELYLKYIEISKERALLESEKELFFLAEQSVRETPFVVQEAQTLATVLRQDFVLQ
ncbi:unnamed protein product, partial [Adineta ricciae]